MHLKCILLQFCAVQSRVVVHLSAASCGCSELCKRSANSFVTGKIGQEEEEQEEEEQKEQEEEEEARHCAGGGTM